ncbi:MAG: flagellar hook protein FlgE [Candidatus Eremiobacteraeota bacterium]|nr:flagellar hook protein FlgE [Candidatus Eremiobacteraeota bacterium]
MAFDSMFIGVTGLEAYQNQIDVISNNIANVGTTGYKGQNVNFQDLIYQAQSYATAPTQTTGGVNGQDAGLGVKLGSIDTNYAQGGLRTTGVNTNLAMNGDGFFILRKPNGSGAPVYTRNGNFSLNSNGLLYDGSNGMAVQGYLADKNGNISQTGTPGDITIPLGLQSQAVGTGLNAKLKFGPSGDQMFDVSLGGNVDQTQWIKEAQGVQNGAAGTGTPYTISTTVYDSLGNAHLAQITYTPDANGATGGNAQIASNTTVNGGAGNLINAISGSTGGKTISVTVNAGGTTATISDGSTTVTGNPGQTLTFDGATFTLGNFVPADAGKSGTINNAGGTNGLPAQVADANGVLHTPAARWRMDISFADGTTFDAIQTPGSIAAGGAVTAAVNSATPVSSGTVGFAYFDQNGQYVNTSSIEGVAAGQSITGANVHAVNTGPSLANGNQLNIRSWGTGSANNSVAPTAGGPAPQTGPIGFDFHNSTSLAGSATANVLAQNGYPAGILSNLTIGNDGTISGAFSNGQSTTLGRVAVATFQNEQGLQRIGGSDFAATANSGLAQVGTAGVGRFGSMVSGSLEQSNVSIAEEFTKMIVAQNAYQSNSKSITIASEDMQTVMQLIR